MILKKIIFIEKMFFASVSFCPKLKKNMDTENLEYFKKMFISLKLKNLFPLGLIIYKHFYENFVMTTIILEKMFFSTFL